MKEAAFYEKTEKGVQCRLCPHLCRLKTGQAGFCGVRRLEPDGNLWALNYGICEAMALDPVEKKPLYHFYPGRTIFSVGTMGCNLDCGFCQNWHLSRAKAPSSMQRLSPGEIVDILKTRTGPDNIGIAYTYSEPNMWYEFVLDTAPLVRESGYKNVMVTNGFLNPEPLKKLLPYIDAFNIDVKAFNDEFYRKHCRGSLEPVKKYVELAAEQAHVELTYLVIPTLNDTVEEVMRFSEWVAGINPDIPVHLNRYYPQYWFTLPPTPVSVLETLRQAAKERLSHVYIGNVPGTDAANTYCQSCGALQVSRSMGRVTSYLNDGLCPGCGRKAPGFGN